MAELTMTPADVQNLAEPIAQRVWELIAERLNDSQRGDTSAPIADREAIASMLSVSTATIDRWVKTGRTPSIGDGNTRRFIVADVIEAERRRAENERRQDQ